MRLLPHTEADRERMLSAIGVSEAQLFRVVPPARFAGIPAATEEAILDSLRPLSQPITDPASGLGLGPYPIPAVVDALSSRGEFVTAYTPYQPECSQGTLAAIFEFQTRVCDLTGLDVANAGLYDGSTACVEAANAALGETGRREILVARSVAPAVREVLGTTLAGRGIVIRELPIDRASGRAADWRGAATSDTAAVIVQSPNVFGVLESEISSIFAAAKAAGAVSIQIFHPYATTVCGRPGDMGADIAVAEGQPLGIPLWGGGPYVGLFAARQTFLRRVPGRIVGRTLDADGRDCFVLTLQTREQHIKRERATSNICTNQALIALRATLFLGALGFEGLRERANQLRSAASEMARGRAIFDGEIFSEFAVRGGGGIPLDYPELGDVSVMGVAR